MIHKFRSTRWRRLLPVSCAASSTCSAAAAAMSWTLRPCRNRHRNRLAGLHQHMFLAPGRQLDDAAWIETGDRDRPQFVIDHGVVEPRPSAFDEAARLAVAFRQSRAAEQFEGRDAFLQLLLRDRE